MADFWTYWSLRIGDALLGWSLRLPWDVTLLILAIGTAALMTLLRRWTTHQDLLRRAAEDARRLNRRIKQARRDKDVETVKRLKGVKSIVAMTKLRAEGKPLLASLLPIAILATWAIHRMEFYPPRANEPVELVVYTPALAAGTLLHVAAPEALSAPDGWVRRVEKVENDGPPHGKASLRICGPASRAPYELAIRMDELSISRQVLLGQTTYTAALQNGPRDGFTTEWKLRQAKFLGMLPGIDALMLAPWLTGYLVVVLPFVLILRKLMRTY